MLKLLFLVMAVRLLRHLGIESILSTGYQIKTNLIFVNDINCSRILESHLQVYSHRDRVVQGKSCSQMPLELNPVLIPRHIKIFKGSHVPKCLWN
ncbi:unnamed protein product, partial [Vitis vinifera]|uniref:Secreted protein n=1 Tax=Vitis vinifera TaxID=29760 RepID=D7T7S9_VITVI